MRVNLHDFSGHPFQAQLSRHLAGLGYDVVHGYCSQFVTGHGLLERRPGDPPGLRFAPLAARAPLVKYAPAGRMRFELSYARAWQRELDGEDFDVVIACNVPLFALAWMRRYFAARRQPWLLWHQDIYSAGVAAEARAKLPPRLAEPVAQAVARIEQAQLRSADAVVAITDGFRRQYREWGEPDSHVQVIPNWAPLSEIHPAERDNEWARRYALPASPLRLLYAGTLGRKHNPLLLLDVLNEVRRWGVDAMLVVASEGVGADDLAVAAKGREDVRIVGFQPAEDLSELLGSADAVLGLLEPVAADFCVPSKILSYLAAGRPIAALVPDGNPAARDVAAAGGFVAPPSRAGARAAGAWLAELAGDALRMQVLGARGRAIAERRFDIDAIGARFDEILHTVVQGRERQLGAGGEQRTEEPRVVRR